MAGFVVERHLTDDFSKTRRGTTIEKQYVVSGAYERGEAESAILANTPPTIGDLTRQSIDVTRQAADMWYATVLYASDELQFGWAFDTSAQTVHITQAKETIFRRQPLDKTRGIDINEPGSAPNEALAIGLTKDRVEGCDIHAPSLAFSRTVTRPSVTLGYLNAALYGLVGKTNRDIFFGFSPGEVLYLGANGQLNETGGVGWTITHNFVCSPHQYNLTFGGPASPDQTIIPRKRGWEYLWVAYRWKEINFPTLKDDGSQVDKTIMIQVPSSAYVQRVYDEGDFRLLEIGGVILVPKNDMKFGEGELKGKVPAPLGEPEKPSAGYDGELVGDPGGAYWGGGDF